MNLEACRGTAELLHCFERFVTEFIGDQTPSEACVTAPSIEVPPELLCFYECALRWPRARLLGTQDFLIPPDRLTVEDGLMVFLVENQQNFRFAIQRTGREWVLLCDLCGIDQEGWRPVSSSLGELLVNYGLQELFFGAPAIYELAEKDWSALDGSFEPLWHGLYIEAEPYEPYEFRYHSAGILVGRLDPNLIGAATHRPASGPPVNWTPWI